MLTQPQVRQTQCYQCRGCTAWDRGHDSVRKGGGRLETGEDITLSLSQRLGLEAAGRLGWEPRVCFPLLASEKCPVISLASQQLLGRALRAHLPSHSSQGLYPRPPSRAAGSVRIQCLFF